MAGSRSENPNLQSQPSLLYPDLCGLINWSRVYGAGHRCFGTRIGSVPRDFLARSVFFGLSLLEEWDVDVIAIDLDLD